MIPEKCFKGLTSHLLHEIGGIFSRLLIMQGAIMMFNFLIWGWAVFLVAGMSVFKFVSAGFSVGFRENY